VNHDRHDRPEERGADDDGGNSEVERRREWQQLYLDGFELKALINDVGHPQDQDRTDDEFRVLGKCGHRGRILLMGDVKSLASEIAIVNAVGRSANDACVRIGLE
jgi:hypothetical protein